MRNKGFTIVELLVTVVLMVMVGLLIGTNMLGILSQEEDNSYEEFKKNLTDAACMYVETGLTKEKRTECKSTNTCTVSIDNLISKGYIEDTLKDPNTDQKVISNKNKYIVSVKWINGEKKCTLDYLDS